MFEKKITKKNFLAYEKVRSEGEFNMVFDYKKASVQANLSEKEYFKIIKNYEKLRKDYL